MSSCLAAPRDTTPNAVNTLSATRQNILYRPLLSATCLALSRHRPPPAVLGALMSVAPRQSLSITCSRGSPYSLSTMLPLQMVCTHAVRVAQSTQCYARLACCALQRSVQALDRSATRQSHARLLPHAGIGPTGRRTPSPCPNPVLGTLRPAIEAAARRMSRTVVSWQARTPSPSITMAHTTGARVWGVNWCGAPGA